MRPGQGLFFPNLPGPGQNGPAAMGQIRNVMNQVQRLERDVDTVKHGLSSVMTSAAWTNGPTTGGGVGAASALSSILPTPARMVVNLGLKFMMAQNEDFAEVQAIKRAEQDMSFLRNRRLTLPTNGGEYERQRRYQAVALDNANQVAAESYAESTDTQVDRFKKAIGFTAAREAKVADFKKLRFTYQSKLSERGFSDVEVKNRTEDLEKSVEKQDRQNAARKLINANSIVNAAYEVACAVCIAQGIPPPDPELFALNDPGVLEAGLEGTVKQAIQAQAKAERLMRGIREEDTLRIKQIELNAQGYWRATHTAEGQAQLWQARAASFLFQMVNHPGIPAMHRS